MVRLLAPIAQNFAPAQSAEDQKRYHENDQEDARPIQRVVAARMKCGMGVRR
jgi:hypothetical protein